MPRSEGRGCSRCGWFRWWWLRWWLFRGCLRTRRLGTARGEERLRWRDAEAGHGRRRRRLASQTVAPEVGQPAMPERLRGLEAPFGGEVPLFLAQHGATKEDRRFLLNALKNAGGCCASGVLKLEMIPECNNQRDYFQWCHSQLLFTNHHEFDFTHILERIATRVIAVQYRVLNTIHECIMNNNSCRVKLLLHFTYSL